MRSTTAASPEPGANSEMIAARTYSSSGTRWTVTRLPSFTPTRIKSGVARPEEGSVVRDGGAEHPAPATRITTGTHQGHFITGLSADSRYKLSAPDWRLSLKNAPHPGHRRRQRRAR